MELRPGYKQTDVGIIPNDWDVKEVKDISPLQRGYDLPTRLLKEGTFPVVYSNGILNFHTDFKVHAPSIVTGRSGTIGAVFFIEDDFWPHNTTLYVTSFLGNHPKFIFYLYCSINLSKFATGSGVPTLNRNDVHIEKVALPPVPEQKAIATALSDVDALITSLDVLIEKKKNIKQATMQELLTGKRRLAGFDGEWVEKPIKDVAPLKRGYDLPTRLLKEGAYPVVYSNGILNFHADFKVCAPGVVTGRSGTIGSVFFIEDEFWPHNTTLYVTDFLGNSHKFVFCLYSFINIKIFATGSGVPTLNRNDLHLKEVKFPPTLAEQEAIATILSDMDTEIQALEARLAKTKTIKSAMMQELLTGKTRLKVQEESHD